MIDKPNILIVDDDQSILEVLEARLLASDFSVLKAGNAKKAIELALKTPPDLMVSDIKMPNMGGMELLSEIKQIRPGLPVIFITAYGTIPDAVNALKEGAVDYISKPFDGKELIAKINSVLNLRGIRSSVRVKKSNHQSFFWGKSRKMKELKTLIDKVAESRANVLILGESGVGKELVAKLIHNGSARKDYPYVVVDCGSTPAGILESELFGHTKGSFTHAVQDKKGLIEAADKGTLFLDEIGNITMEMQTRLLRFLEDRKIRPVGSIDEINVDARVISATNADLPSDIEEGKFRQDLFYRLKVVTITIPPLRERKEDIPQLAEFLAEKYCEKENIEKVSFSEKTFELMENYPWPGNVRELKHAVEAGIILSGNGVIEPSDLQLEETVNFTAKETEENKTLSLDESEKNTIIKALMETKGIQSRAADLLNISRRAIHYKIQKYGINASDYKR